MGIVRIRIWIGMRVMIGIKVKIGIGIRVRARETICVQVHVHFCVLASMTTRLQFDVGMDLALDIHTHGRLGYMLRVTSSISAEIGVW